MDLAKVATAVWFQLVLALATETAPKQRLGEKSGPRGGQTSTNNTNYITEIKNTRALST